MGRKIKALIEHEFDDELFCTAFHPETASFVTGHATGQLTAYNYTIGAEPVIAWTTKRHKASCRVVSYDQSGKCE
jgi:hypothetical protein